MRIWEIFSTFFIDLISQDRFVCATVVNSPYNLSGFKYLISPIPVTTAGWLETRADRHSAIWISQIAVMRGVKAANGASADQTVHLLAADTCNTSTWEPETGGKSGVQVYPGLHETHLNTKLNKRILCRRSIHHLSPHCFVQVSQVPIPRSREKKPTMMGY